ncbi:MAG TPA: hypothetical protein VM802_09070 [Chitinophaga sp.]|uniref:hypothetical protein n=1 Tax=Chitinophaga sp. TaxID=1869181 RepID=UPI002C72FD54|nr:hypothetical protein [Chitinophaga sp.]HVI45010.1 hypothetical protein [Chitinophaga sp.]
MKRERKITCSLYITMLAVILLASCSKDADPVERPVLANISFYNASTALTGEFVHGGSISNHILIDSYDTTYQDKDNIIGKVPGFGLSYLNAFPNLIQGWTAYQELLAGAHKLILADTSGRVLDSNTVRLDKDIPATVFYGDSLGHYRSIALADKFIPAEGKIGVRIINLSPSTDSVYITFNKEVPAGFPSATYYGNYTSFIPVDFTGRSTINVKVLKKSQERELLAGTVLEAAIGHAYTLVISGYSDNNPGIYIDPRKGRSVEIKNNFTITVIKNF